MSTKLFSSLANSRERYESLVKVDGLRPQDIAESLEVAKPRFLFEIETGEAAVISGGYCEGYSLDRRDDRRSTAGVPENVIVSQLQSWLLGNEKSSEDR